MKPTLSLAFVWVAAAFAGSASASEAIPALGGVPRERAEQRKRAEALQAKGPEASVTVIPSLFFTWEHSGSYRTERLAGFLELAGMKNVEVGASRFTPSDQLELPQLAEALGAFIRMNPVFTDCALYAEFTGETNTLALQDMRAVVVDKRGALVWSDHQTARDEAFRRLKAEQVADGREWQPENMSLLLVERVSPLFGLTALTRAAAQPKSVWGLLVKARMSMRAKKYEEARDAFQKVAAIDPAVGEAWSGQVGALNRLKRPQEARFVISQWLQAQPDSVAPWEFLFLTSGFTARHKEAMEALDRLIALRPGEGSYRMARGQQFEYLGRRDEAAEEYAKAATLDATEHDIGADAFNAAAELLRAKGKFAEAIACYTRASALDPKNPQPVYRRAVAQAQSGDSASALADLAKSVELEPRMKSAARQESAFRGLRDSAAFKELMK